MSDAQKALDMLQTINTDTKDMQNRIIQLEDFTKNFSAEEQASFRDSIKRIEESLVKQDEAYDNIVKSIEADKAKTKMFNSIDADDQKRKEFAEFAKGLRAIAAKSIDAFKTSEFKSVEEYKNYISGDDQLGGVAVIPQIDSQIDKLIREFSEVRNLASVSTVSTDKWEQIKMAQGNGATWEKDMSNYTDQTKNNTFGKLNITVEDLYSIAIFHKNLVDDEAFNLVGEVLMSMAEDFAIAEGTSFWTGNGKGEMSGILNAPAVGSGQLTGFDEVERVPTAASTTITIEDIYELTGALKVGYQSDAQFRCNRKTITLLRKLRSDSGAGAGTGTFLWQPSVQAGVPATLDGYPISQAQELTATPEAASAESIVFGSFRRGYKVIDRMGIEVLRDNLTAYPSIAYKAHKRVGGGVSKGEALKILQVTP